MTLETAQQIVTRIAKARKRWGKLATPPYTDAQLYDALVLLEENGKFEACPDAEEVTKIRRQLAACTNREKARQNKGTDSKDN